MGNEFTLSIDDHIDLILDNFDFEKVLKIMDYLGTYREGLSNIDDLKSKSAEMLYKVSKLDYGDYIYQSGLRATKYNDFLELSYNVEFEDSVKLNNTKEYKNALRIKQRKEKILHINEKEKETNKLSTKEKE